MTRLDTQLRVIELVESALGRRVYDGRTPDWLTRPGRREIGVAWRTARLMYRRLTGGMELPDLMPPGESRQIDGIIGGRGLRYRILEVDEPQHFNEFRALTLRLYSRDAPVAFPMKVWMARSKDRGRDGGRSAGRLFPMRGGRHRQRAFRDELTDLLPPLHGYAPTLRIGEFEVAPWMHERGAVAKMRTLLEERLSDDRQVTDG